MDTVKAIIEEINAVLTQDQTLIIAMDGEVRCYLDEAAQDAEFPYLVYSISCSPTNWPLYEGTYTLALWDQSKNEDRLLAVRARTRALLVQARVTVSGGEAKALRFFARPDQEIPEPDLDTWRREMAFGLRYYDTVEAAAVAART